MFFMSQEKSQMVQRDQALPGRDSPIATASTHFVTGRPLQTPLSEGCRRRCSAWAVFGVWSVCFGELKGSG